jgi:chromosome segregation ATPase
MATVKSLDTDIAVIKNEVSQFGQLLNKLETALDKIADVSNNIGQILAVHEQRLKDGEVHFEELRKDMDEAEDKFDDEVKDLHSRLTTNTREIEQKMSNEIDKVLEAIKDLKSHLGDKQSKLEDRLTALERWRWILLGIVLAGGVILGNGLNLGSVLL